MVYLHFRERKTYKGPQVSLQFSSSPGIGGIFKMTVSLSVKKKKITIKGKRGEINNVWTSLDETSKCSLNNF